MFAHQLNYSPTRCVTWQVKSGTLFSNVLITDDAEYAKQLAEDTWGKHKDVSCIFLLIFESTLESVLLKVKFDWDILILQAEKAAFDEAEKKREEEVHSLPLYSVIRKLLKFNLFAHGSSKCWRVFHPYCLYLYLFLCSFLTLEFNSLPGSKGRSSWFWCKSTSKLIFGNYETAMFTVVLILPICFSGWGWRWWCRRWNRWRVWCWIQGWKQRRCRGWNQGRWETCRVSFLLMKLYHFCSVLNCVLIFFLVLYVCRMNCKGLEGSGHKGWAWSGPKKIFLVYF